MTSLKQTQVLSAMRRGLSLVWNAMPASPVDSPARTLARWTLKGHAAETKEAPPAELAHYFTGLPARCALHVEHRISPAAMAAPGYECRIRLMGPARTSPDRIEAVAEMLRAMATGTWFEPDEGNDCDGSDDWPVVAMLRPASVRLWHGHEARGGAPTDPLLRQMPYPTMWPTRPLKAPLAMRGQLAQGILIVQRIRSFELPEEQQADVHATMRLIEAGALRCFAADSPHSYVNLSNEECVVHLVMTYASR